MPALSSEIAAQFFTLCNWTHTAWSMHRAFEDDPRTSEAGKAGHAYFLNTLSIISQEYILLQIAKLHDPACQQNRLNLTIKYVLEYGGWDGPTRRRLDGLAGELDALYARIRPARNRVISHNDLATILDDSPLGSFPEGLDDSYFAKLEELASLVHETVIGHSMAFDRFVRTDVAILLNALSKSIVANG